MSTYSHYPSFDVMKEHTAWDDHTQSIVSARLEASHRYSFLSSHEADMLKQISSLLVDDQTAEVLNFIIQHIDQTLSDESIGEGQRKPNEPRAQQLIREGLVAVEQSVKLAFNSFFLELSETEQKQFLQDMSSSKIKLHEAWERVPQESLFKKLLDLTIEAYCSHPKVWSAIGYAGPAYPRGYVRTQLGQLDPWEAQPE